MVTEAQVREALKDVRDPEIGRPIDEIGMLRTVEIDGGVVRQGLVDLDRGWFVHRRIPYDGLCKVRTVSTRAYPSAEQRAGGHEEESPWPRKPRSARR